MIEGITAKTVGSSETFLCLLCRDHDLIQRKRILVQYDPETAHILSCLHLDCNSHISQARYLHYVFSFLDICEDEFSVKSGGGPEVILSKTDNSTDYRPAGFSIYDGSFHLQSTSGCIGSLGEEYREDQQ